MKTRKPTGKPHWPLILLAGTEKSGKSYAAAAASASPLIGATYWIGFGEDDPDEYGQIGRFEIVEHEGTYRDLLRAIDEVNQLPAGDKPTLLVLDSATRVWDMLKDETQEVAWRRAKAKAERQRQRFDKAADEVRPSMDLWNLAAQRWAHIMAALRKHSGPVIVTARLDEVNVIGRNDQPTGEKAWSIQAHKSLPYDVGAIVEFRGYRNALVRGVRSLRWQHSPDDLVPVRDFTVESLWTVMGLADSTDRSHAHVDAAASVSSDERPDMGAIKARIASHCPVGVDVKTWALGLFADRNLDAASIDDALQVLAELEATS